MSQGAGWDEGGADQRPATDGEQVTTGPGHGALLHLTRDGDAPRGSVLVEVIDQGDGIRSSEMTKIFEPFFTTKPPGRGTGLGLSICYSIVAEHGGRIEVDSVVAQGSVFRIVLPEVTPDALRAAV